MQLAAFDVETSGEKREYALQPFRARMGQAWLTSWAVATQPPGANEPLLLGVSMPVDGVMLNRVHATGTMRKFLRDCAARKLRIVCWNSAFDVAWLIAYGLRKEVFACEWLDAMLLYKNATASPEWTGLAPRNYGLKDAVAKFYPEEAGYGDGIDFADMSPEMVAKRLTYNVKDAKFTLMLANKFIAELTPEQLRVALIEAACIPMVAETLVEGIAVHADKAQVIADELERISKVTFVTLKMEEPLISPELLASPTQLRELLYKVWGLPVVKMTKGTETNPAGNASTDKDALDLLGVQEPRAKLLHKYREAVNNRTKFAMGVVNSAAYNGDGMVRPAFRINGTYTSRGTYSSRQKIKGTPAIKAVKGVSPRIPAVPGTDLPTGIALHQWPRTKFKGEPEYRALIRAPDGYDLLEWDFAGQEYRWMAVESLDPKMLELCQPGEDAHAFMGGKVSGTPYDKMKLLKDTDDEIKRFRQMGKVGNLALQYRMFYSTLQTVARVQHRMILTEIEAKALWSTYKLTYRRVPDYWKRQIYKAKTDGYVETQAGRRLYLGTGDTWPANQTWGRESASLNFPIQGVGGDQKYLALRLLRDYLPRVGGRFYFELHDGLFAIAPKAKSERCAHEVQKLLSNLPYKAAWGKTFPVEFPVDAKRGPSWGELEVLH